jgi:hypothetical protein
MIARVLVLAFVLAFPVHGQDKLGQPEVPPDARPGPFTLLPDRDDVLPWKLLAQVELVKANERVVPQFSQAVTALDQRVVKVQGFMMPLQVGDKQTHFVLSPMPQHCPYCVQGGAESLVEVRTKKPVKYTFEPVVISGRLSVLKEDPTGVFYRISDGQESK